jgi:putative transposon-encoded protein
MKEIEIKTKCYGTIEKVAKNGGHSARVFVPTAWKDKRVLVLLMEPVE